MSWGISSRWGKEKVKITKKLNWRKDRDRDEREKEREICLSRDIGDVRKECI